MNICFRVDSSTTIGTGHLMRCLTLAEELKKNGHTIYFISRLHKGNVCDFITAKGFHVFELKSSSTSITNLNDSHASWLGVSAEQDLQETIQFIKTMQIQFDWIIIDHYAIDLTWEKEIRKYIPKIMVIDDLADRKHDCDVLLDQNYYKNAKDRYTHLVPSTCKLLLGPRYALLRNEFVHLHQLPKIQNEHKSVLVSYGGSDPTNETSKAINALSMIESTPLKTHVVVGPSNPNRALIQKQCEENEYFFHFNIDYMAKLMHEVDFAICAGGSITWERYCLGTPAILTAIADNQIELCENIKLLGIDHYLGVSDNVTELTIKDKVNYFMNIYQLDNFSIKAKKIVDGKGKFRVINILNTLKS